MEIKTGDRFIDQDEIIEFVGSSNGTRLYCFKIIEPKPGQKAGDVLIYDRVIFERSNFEKMADYVSPERLVQEWTKLAAKAFDRASQDERSLFYSMIKKHVSAQHVEEFLSVASFPDKNNQSKEV